MEELCGWFLCPTQGKHTKDEHADATIDEEMEIAAYEPNNANEEW